MPRMPAVCIQSGCGLYGCCMRNASSIRDEQRLLHLAIAAGATVQIVNREGSCMAETKGDEKAMLDVVRDQCSVCRSRHGSEVRHAAE